MQKTAELILSWYEKFHCYYTELYSPEREFPELSFRFVFSCVQFAGRGNQYLLLFSVFSILMFRLFPTSLQEWCSRGLPARASPAWFTRCHPEFRAEIFLPLEGWSFLSWGLLRNTSLQGCGANYLRGGEGNQRGGRWVREVVSVTDPGPRRKSGGEKTGWRKQVPPSSACFVCLLVSS